MFPRKPPILLQCLESVCTQLTNSSSVYFGYVSETERDVRGGGVSCRCLCHAICLRSPFFPSPLLLSPRPSTSAKSAICWHFQCGSFAFIRRPRGAHPNTARRLSSCLPAIPWLSQYMLSWLHDSKRLDNIQEHSFCLQLQAHARQLLICT